LPAHDGKNVVTILRFPFIGDAHLFIPEEESLGRLSTAKHLQRPPSP